MSKNPNPSMLDSGQLWKKIFQTEHDALRVVPAMDVETSFSLCHKEDSIASKCSSEVIPVNEKVDCSHLKKVMSYGNGSITVWADDNTQMTMPIIAAQIMEICAMSLQCDVVLVGQ